MGSTSHLTPGAYSLKFNDFLAAVVQARGGRPTERWAEANMPSVRGRSYWAKLLSGKQAMTTEDIAVIAGWLEVDPFAFVRAVREGDVAAVVGGPAHDESSAERDDDILSYIPHIGRERPIPVKKAARTKRGPREDEVTSS